MFVANKAEASARAPFILRVQYTVSLGDQTLITVYHSGSPCILIPISVQFLWIHIDTINLWCSYGLIHVHPRIRKPSSLGTCPRWTGPCLSDLRWRAITHRPCESTEASRVLNGLLGDSACGFQPPPPCSSAMSNSSCSSEKKQGGEFLEGKNVFIWCVCLSI